MSEEPENQSVSNARYKWLVTGKTILGFASAAFYILGAFTFYMAAAWMFWYPLYGLICTLATVFLITVAFFLYRAAKGVKPEMAIISDSEKPRKLVVSKGRYAMLIAQRTVLTTGAIQLFVICGLSSVVCISSISTRVMGFAAPSLGVAVTTLLLGLCLIKIEQKVERVAPATQQNTQHLPEIQTLVRPSDLPPSHQPAELLRMAQSGDATPADELLRITRSGQGE
jgi:hypothetical protein